MSNQNDKMGDQISRVEALLYEQVIPKLNQIDTMNKKLDKIENDVTVLKDNVNVLKGDVKVLKDAVLVPDGDDTASKVTVSVSVEGEGEIGQGMIIVHSNRYFLLSAAHVVVLLTRKDKKLTLRHRQTQWSCQVEPTNLYIPENYVLHEKNDIGLLEIKSTTEDGFGTNAKQRFQCDKPEIGQSAVSRGKVFLRGIVTSLIDRDTRFSVMGHSVCGSSGSPIFNNQKCLIGVVHGVSKQRGRHSASQLRDDTAIVYCDAFVITSESEADDNNLSFLKVPEDGYENLRLAESLPESGYNFPESRDENENMTDTIPDLHTLKDNLNLKYIANSQDLMKKLAESLWTSHAKENPLELKEGVMQVTFEIQK